MKRQGKAHWIVVASLASVVVLGGVLFSATRGPGATATDFMEALAEANAGKLAEITTIGSDDAATRKAKWERTLSRGKHYLFVWKMLETVNTGENRAVAKVMMVRNATLRNAYDELYEIPLVRKDGAWLVDVAGIDREIFPSLPSTRPLDL